MFTIMRDSQEMQMIRLQGAYLDTKHAESRGEIKSRVTKIARSSTKPQEHVHCALCTEIRIYVSFKFVLLVILVDG